MHIIRFVRLSIFWLSGVIGLALLGSFPARAQGLVSCAAAESAPGVAYVTVNPDQPQVNVRSGPNSYLYGKVGLLLSGQSAPALGRSPGGDWIQIACPAAPGGVGWVYAANVTLTAEGDLPIVTPPATATPLVTATVDPRLMAQFPTLPPTATRLPTFTPVTLPPPPDLSRPPDASPGNGFGGAIIGAAGTGILLLLASLLLRR